MRALLRKFLNDAYFRTSAVILGLSLITYVGQYCFHVFTNRNLSKDGYGLFNTILSLSVILSALSSILNQWITKCFSEAFSYKSYSKMARSLLFFYKYSMSLFFIILFAVTISMTGMRSVLKSDTNIPFIILLGVLFVDYIRLPLIAFLQGAHAFVAATFSGVLDIVLKNVFLAVFLLSGLSLIKTLGAQLIGSILAAAFLIAVVVLKIRSLNKVPLQTISNDVVVKDSKNLLSFVKVGLPVALVTVLLNVDVVIARLNLPAAQSGEYSFASVFGRAVYYLGSLNLPILFVSLNKKHNLGESYRRILLKGTIVLLSTVVAALLGMLFLLRPFIVLVNPEYLNALPMIQYYAVSMLPYLFIHFFVTLFLSINRHKVFVYFGIATVLSVACVKVFGHDMSSIITVRFVTGLVMLLILVCQFFLLRRSEVRAETGS